MSRKRRRQLSVQSPPQSPPQTQSLPDARREVAARASKALRSVEAAKLRNTLIQAFNREVLHEQVRTVPHRPVGRQSVPSEIHRRTVPSLTEVRRSPLSPQVRDSLQDGIRALACHQRRTRKEVIFALRRAGKAGSGNKKAKWSEKSHMRCK